MAAEAGVIGLPPLQLSTPPVKFRTVVTLAVPEKLAAPLLTMKLPAPEMVEPEPKANVPLLICSVAPDATVNGPLEVPPSVIWRVPLLTATVPWLLNGTPM